MSEPIALYENDESPIEGSIMPTTTSRSLFTQFARIVSTVLSPATISLPFILLVSRYHAGNSALLFALITLFFLSIGPLIYIVIGVATGKLTDLDVSVRTQRIKPYLFSIASSLLGLLIMSINHGPKNLTTALLTSTISNCIMLIITFWWKISMHAASISGVVTMLTALYGVVMLPACFLIILVSWSRVVLHRHTIAQVMAGSLMSIILTASVLALRGT